MRTTLLYTTLLVLLSFASAWPWPRFLPEIDALIVRRQNKSDTTSATDNPTGTSTPTSTPTTGAKSTGSMSITTAPSSTGSSHASGSSSGSNSGSSSGSASGSSKPKTTTTKRTSYDPRLPAGGITMLTPAATSGTPVYKISNYVTFGFNYTSLSATPTALNIMATCTANSHTYTIAMNHTADQTVVVWNTSYIPPGTPPLLTEIYTLIIYDADGTPTDAAQAGYLAPYTGTVFGMYEKKPYADEGSIKCTTCSGAISSVERSALSFVFAMGLATVLGFTWL